MAGVKDGVVALVHDAEAGYVADVVICGGGTEDVGVPHLELEQLAGEGEVQPPVGSLLGKP